MEYKDFLAYLKKEKKVSENTLMAYMRDIRAFEKYLTNHNSSLESATKTDVISYIMELGKDGKSKSTTNRKLASIRALYAYLMKIGISPSDPSEGIKTPRAERKDLDYLTQEEVSSLLSKPDNSIKGKRDKAIMEVLYGTGMRAMELIELNYGDLNLRMGYLQCSGEHGRARIVPLGSYAKSALTEYLRESRPALLGDEDNKEAEDRPLFVNYTGERLTRQGLWKLLAQYGKELGMEGRISPQSLRTTFAVHMIENGADIKTLQELMGYDDVQALQAFLKVSKTKIKDVYDKAHPRA